MKLFTLGGGGPPWFPNRIKVRIFTSEMYDWCVNYPLDGCCERWYVEWGKNRDSEDRKYDVLQLESDKAAYMFKIAFSEHIL